MSVTTAPRAPSSFCAAFVYADPGRDTDTELRSWVDSHRRLWVRLRDAGTRVHVAVVTRTLEAWSDYRRTLDRWLSPRPGGGSFSGGASTPGEQQVLDLIYAALRSERPAALDPWGGTPANAPSNGRPITPASGCPRRPHRQLLHAPRGPSRTGLACALIVSNQSPNREVTETAPPPSHPTFRLPLSRPP